MYLFEVIIVVVNVIATARGGSSLRAKVDLPFGKRRVDHIIGPTRKDMVESNTVWLSRQDCPDDQLYVQGFRTWQDNSAVDAKGITRIEFSCSSKPRRLGFTASGIVDTGHWIGSGHASGTHMSAKYCPNQFQFVVGVEVTFCGTSYGACDLHLVCDVPVDWSMTEEGKKGLLRPAINKINNTLAVFRFDLHAANNNWQRIGQLCSDGKVVCGLAVKFHDPTLALLTDLAGVNEVQISCCSFPQPEPPPFRPPAMGNGDTVGG